MTDPPSRCVRRPLSARSTVDFPDPVAPDSTVRVPGASTSSSMRTPGPPECATLAPRTMTGASQSPGTEVPANPRSSRAAATAVARARVRSSTGASTLMPPRSPRRRWAKRTERTASARAGRAPHATARVRAIPRSGPRREPRANSRGRSRRALTRPKARMVSAIGSALAAASQSPPVVTGPSSTTCANGGARRTAGSGRMTAPEPSAPWKRTR